FPASIVFVCLLLLLIGITFLILALQKRCKMQAQLPTIPSDQGVYSTAQLPTIPSDQDVYSTAQLPTIPSDQGVYSTAQLPTIPSDQDVYSTAQLPTIPSDQDIYSTAQVPTGQSAEKPAEGLTYAAVSFHSNTTSTNDAVPQVREDVTCDYASVSHATSSGLSVSRAVSAHAGGGVNIKCRYEEKYKDTIKSFFHDNRSAGFFSVFIRELITEDTGTYACAVDVFDRIQTDTVVKLDVRGDLSYEKSISETVHSGGDLNIGCKYPESIRSNPKFLCKMSLQDSACSYKISVKENRKYINMGKFSGYVDRERRILTVSIRNVTARDSGEYWCGAEAAWESDQGYKVYFTQINLTVTASTLIPVSVILLLLLIGVIFLTLFLQKRRKMQGGASIGQCPVQNSVNDQEVPLAVCEYEEIKDTRELSALDAGSSAVYSNVRLSTTLSDPSQPFHDTTGLPTIPCDSTIYSTAQLPTIPSDQGVYSTAQGSASLE
ncbi:polymeric immunoglobulin receptor-like isoform X4, partial [Clarias magur]